MSRILTTAALSLCALLLGGCATTVSSTVATFHQWPAALEDKSYVFELPPSEQETLEWRSYQQVVKNELAKHGFVEANGAPPALAVAMRFASTEIPVQLVVPYMPPFAYQYPNIGFRMPSRPMATLYRGVYDPFWGPHPAYQRTVDDQFKRELRIVISSARDGQRLYDVSVQNISDNISTPEIMPAMVQSAFTDFPGQSGKVRRVVLKQQPSAATAP